MLMDLGSRVVASTGEDLGRVVRLVLDSSGQKVRSVVVERGLLLKDAFEIPAEALTESVESANEFTITEEAARSLTRYDESRYVDVPEDVRSPFGFPAGGIVWPVAAPIGAAPYGQGVYPVIPADIGQPPVNEEPDERWEAAHINEQEYAVIERGAQVVSSDGEAVGEVDSVSFDPSSGRPVSLLVRRGILFSEDVEIPAAAVESADDNVITLKADMKQIDLWSRDNTVLLF